MFRPMSEPHAQPFSPQSSTLKPLEPIEQREVLRTWSRSAESRAGERGPLPATPDDQVAHALLNAAGIAIGEGRWQRGLRILRLTTEDYPHSQEAACARTVIDRLTERSATRGR